MTLMFDVLSLKPKHKYNLHAKLKDPRMMLKVGEMLYS